MSEGLSLYDEDFVRWSEEQAAAIRVAASSGTNLPLDWENIAEEIESLGKSVRSELRNRLTTVIEHLIKLRISPAFEPRAAWANTIRREQVEIGDLLSENPSLRADLTRLVESAERKARRLAQVSLEDYGEWTPDARRLLAEARFDEQDVVGRRL